MSEKTVPPAPTTGSTTSFFPPKNTGSLQTRYGNLTEFRAAAMYWYGYGFKVIPLIPVTKKPAVTWDKWLDSLDPENINEYWVKNPRHELAFIVGDDMIVFDADAPESVAVIAELEARFSVTPSLVVKTSKGEHHYFRRAEGTVAKSDSHSSVEHPDRLDIKTGRNLVILPPSTGKSILTNNTENMNELSEATQEFIDAVNLYNGRTAPSQKPIEKVLREYPTLEGEDGEVVALLQTIENLLEHYDASCSYDDWVRVGMVISNETKGSYEGMELFDRWSSKGNTYKGRKEIETKWSSFRSDASNAVGIGTLFKIINDALLASSLARYLAEPDFECHEEETIVRYPPTTEPHKTTRKENPLDRFSLRGMLGELEKQVSEQVYVLDDISLMGQATVIYAAPNTGKTLLTLHLLMQSIAQGRIDQDYVYYINEDDTSGGLLEKARIAEEYGFHIITGGHRDFDATDFLASISKFIEFGDPRNVVIILDTLKKFVDTNGKSVSREFTGIIRNFVKLGGTIIALSHINKNRDASGKAVRSGTTDILDDFDCGYILDTLEKGDKSRCVVEFTNIKKRGNVAPSVAYSYSLERGISYSELLMSIEKEELEEHAPSQKKDDDKSDTEAIAAITSCIKDGIKSKMELGTHAAERAKISGKKAIKIIEKYTGDDPAKHFWNYVVGARGAKFFELLERPTEQSETPVVTPPT